MKPEDVRRVAELARIDIPDGELDRTARELSAVLAFAATLERLDLSGLEPSVFAPVTGALRDDALDTRCLTSEQATAAAPERDADYFVVPPIVENLEP